MANVLGSTSVFLRILGNLRKLDTPLAPYSLIELVRRKAQITNTPPGEHVLDQHSDLSNKEIQSF